MDDKSSKFFRAKSQITYDYITIKITQSRINKGLLAFPRALADWFPNQNETIQVYLSDSPTYEMMNYSSYKSSTREGRIGGLKQWFQQNNIRSGEEIVIQLIDKNKYIYRLIPEKNFIFNTKDLQSSFDATDNDTEAKEKVSTLSHWTNINQDEVVLNEFIRLINSKQLGERQYTKRILSRSRESIPANIRTLLRGIYKGHCQVCDFWFLKKDKEPYFEVHHLDKEKGHHPKNLVVVCGNCHNQFEQANVKQQFNATSWLIGVSFNENLFPVKQVAIQRETEGFHKNLFI